MRVRTSTTFMFIAVIAAAVSAISPASKDGSEDRTIAEDVVPPPVTPAADEDLERDPSSPDDRDVSIEVGFDIIISVEGSISIEGQKEASESTRYYLLKVLKSICFDGSYFRHFY